MCHPRPLFVHFPYFSNINIILQHRSNIGVLANGTFQEEARDADGDKHHEVGNDECPTSVLEAEVGETPDVAQS